MEVTNVPSTVRQHAKSTDTVDANRTFNGNGTLPNDLRFHHDKTMHVMVPGPKKHQTVKKSSDKEPKFVPYEPYKAAIRSIVPELSQPSVAIFKRKLSTASNCSKGSNMIEDKEDAIVTLTNEKQVRVVRQIVHSRLFSTVN